MPARSQRLLRTAIASLFVPLAIAGAVLPQAALAAPATSAASVKPNAAFDKWADQFAQEWVRGNPQFATATQYFSGAEQDALDRQLTPQTPAQRKKMIAKAKEGIARLDLSLIHI